MLTEEQKAQGWVEHDGGQCPLPMWQVLLRDGRIMRTRGDTIYWPHFGDDDFYDSDVIAYRKEPTQ